MAFLSMGPLSSSPISAIPGARVAQNRTLTLNDTVGTSDLISSVGGSAFAFNDPVGVSDVFSRVVTYARTLPDTVVASDALTKALTRARSFGDSAGATDSFSKVFSRERTLVDLVAAVDTFTKGWVYARQFDDYVEAVDHVAFHRYITLNDTVGTDDDLNVTVLKFFHDFLTATDDIFLNLTRTGLDLTAEPDLSYVAGIVTSHRYRLDATASSHLFIDSVEEYSPEETRSPAHAT